MTVFVGFPKSIVKARWISICALTMMVVLFIYISLFFLPSAREVAWEMVDPDSTTDTREKSSGLDISVPKEGGGGHILKGRDILLVVGTDGKSHPEIKGMMEMVRDNRQQYADFHGSLFK